MFVARIKDAPYPLSEQRCTRPLLCRTRKVQAFRCAISSYIAPRGRFSCGRRAGRLAARDVYAVRRPESNYGSPIVICRNNRGATVTADVGLPVSGPLTASVLGELNAGKTPTARPIPDGDQICCVQILMIGNKLADASAWQLTGASGGSTGEAIH